MGIMELRFPVGRPESLLVPNSLCRASAVGDSQAPTTTAFKFPMAKSRARNCTVVVDGVGGNTNGTQGRTNYGVYVLSTNGRIELSGGKVEVIGVGGGSGNGDNNYGVYVNAAGQITALGMKFPVEGWGGTTTGDRNYGVLGCWFKNRLAGWSVSSGRH